MQYSEPKFNISKGSKYDITSAVVFVNEKYPYKYLSFLKNYNFFHFPIIQEKITLPTYPNNNKSKEGSGDLFSTAGLDWCEGQSEKSLAWMLTQYLYNAIVQDIKIHVLELGRYCEITFAE